jgi:predicted dithiol-disulfide oxidoreductase (DUF899 family)
VTYTGACLHGVPGLTSRECRPAAPDDDAQPRHGDTLEPLWNLFDLTPEGRGTDWYPDLSYT